MYNTTVYENYAVSMLNPSTSMLNLILHTHYVLDLAQRCPGQRGIKES